MSTILFVISIISGLLYFTAYNIGFAIEKKVVDSLPEEMKKNPLKMFLTLITNVKWLGGLALTILSVVFYLVALIWAPITAIAPLSGFGLIVLTIFAHFNMKETLKKKEIIAIGIIIIGISFSSLITSSASVTLSYTEWNTTLFSVSSLLIITISVAIGFMGIIFSITKKMSFSTIAFSMFAGIASGLQTIVFKGIAYIISSNNLISLIFPLLIYILLIGVTGVCSTFGLQIAFRDRKISNAMTIYNGIMTVLPIIYGSIALNEWSSIRPIFQVFLGLSIAVVSIGIIFLSLTHKHPQSFSESNL